MDIIEKFTEKVEKRLKRGKELVEVIHLKNEIKAVQDLINLKFQTIGKKVFEMINRGDLNEEELKTDCKEIALLFRKITELESTIKQLEFKSLESQYGFSVILCPQCKHPNKSDTKFCVNCGTKIIKDTEVQSCPICNATLKKDAKFCIRCGAKIK